MPSVTPLGISSHGNPWRPHPSGLLIPETPGVETRRSSPAPYHAAVFCWLLFFPRPQKPHVPFPEATSPPPGPIPPGTSASPYPVVVPKHDVTAERHVDVQVHLLDVPGGDQGLLFHFLCEYHGGGASVRDSDPDMSPGAILGREPRGHHGIVSCGILLPSPGKLGTAGVPSMPMDLCEGLCPAVVGGEVTEVQPGWEGTGGQSRWEGDMGVLCTRWRI